MKKIIYLIMLISLISGKMALSQTSNTGFPGSLTNINDLHKALKTNKINIINADKSTIGQTKIIMGPPPTPIYWENFEDSNGNIYFRINGGEFISAEEVIERAHVTPYVVGSAGFTSHVLKITPISLGEPTGTPPSTTMNRRVGTYISVVKGKTYSVRFKAAADSARTIDVLSTQKYAPFDTALWVREIPLDTTLTTCGSYLLNWGQNVITKSAKSQKLNSANTFGSDESSTDSMAFEFAVGASLIPVYLDDIEIIEVAAPEINIVQEDSIIEDNSGIYDFGDVVVGSSESVLFIIENTGTASLNLSEGTTKVNVQSDNGFTLKTDAVSPVISEGSTTFEVLFEPTSIGEATGTISIENNDASENPYNFTIVGLGVNTTATVEIDDVKSDIKIYPNPTSQDINISIASVPATYFIELYNNLGQMVLQKHCTDQTEKLDVKSLNNGIYYLNIFNDEFSRTEKIIVK